MPVSVIPSNSADITLPEPVRVQTPRGARWLAFTSVAVLSAIVFFIYHSSTATGFFADDYNFLEPVARLDTLDYFIRYFDPRLQTMWYRPLQGAQIWIEWQLFGTNAAGYHVVSILIHAINVALLFALVWRIARKWRIGFVAAFFYATFPVYALAINWINITDPIATIFYLAGIWWWWSYLREGKRRDGIATLVAYVIGLLFKQMVITLPVVLVLLEYLIANRIARLADWKNLGVWRSEIQAGIRRYWAFGVIAGGFALIQYTTQSTHTFATVFGYALGAQIVSIVIQYLSLTVFPYGYFLPTDTQFTEGMPFSDARNLVWLACALAIYVFVAGRTRSRVLLFLGLTWVITIAPVLPFPFIELRYLYLPMMTMGIVLALWLDCVLQRVKRPRLIGALCGVTFALITLGSAVSIANANAEIFEFARQRRVPFRDISRAHPTFPKDTRLYFIDSISPVPELSGMFTLRYGRGVTVGGNDFWRDPIARLRDHQNAWVYYFDPTGKPMEVPVETAFAAQFSPAVPIQFAAPLRLDGVELPRATLRRGDMLIALTYWRATGKIEKDYTIFAHLVDKENKNIAGADTPPRKGALPTSHWASDQFVAEAFVIPVPADARAGDYRLEIGVYESASQTRLAMRDASGQTMGDVLVIAPLHVVEK